MATRILVILVLLSAPWCHAQDVAIAPAVQETPLIEWTEFHWSENTRIIYVSSSQGDDAALRPGTAEYPYKTIKAAMKRIQNGYADWLVLKCGDRFDTAWGHDLRWTWSGKSDKARMLVASYGTGPRPVVPGLETEPGGKGTRYYMRHVAFRGLHFTGGVDIRTGGDDVLFEDCYFENCGASVQGIGVTPHVPELKNVTFRRCFFDRNWRPGGRPQGLYCSKVNGLLIEGCVFWRAGWDPNREEARASYLNHNVYLQTDCYNVVFRGNISADPSSHGVQMRRGGLCEGNLFLHCPIAITFGSRAIEDYPDSFATGVVRWNVILDSRDIDVLPRGHAMWLDNLREVEIYKNIIANNVNGSAATAFSMTGAGHADINLHDNLIYQWSVPEHPEYARVLFVDAHGDGQNRFVSNTVVCNRAEEDLFEFRAARDAWLIQDNVFEQDRAIDGLSIEAYMTSLGLEGGLEQFITECLKQRKRAWRNEFTASAVVRFMRERIKQ